MPASRLEVREVTKRYGHVTALDGVSFCASAGEAVALLGDNGAGKSTLVRILSGVTHPDAGEIVLDGEPAALNSPAQARRHGVETVYQNLALAENLDVASNLFLNRELLSKNWLLSRLGWVDDNAMRRRSVDILTQLGVKLSSVRQDVELLSGGQRQGVAVGRAVGWGSSVVLLDEPAAALGVEQTAQVLDLVVRLKKTGVLVILITHNLQEAFQVCDRAVVLRRGRVVADVALADVTSRDLVDHITGSS